MIIIVVDKSSYMQYNVPPVLNANKDSNVQIMIVFLEANFKSDNRPEPVDTLGISTSFYYLSRPLMGP